MYEIEENVFKKNVNLFIEILQMEKFIDQPIRQLSLGQKMRANFALSFLHNPKIVYLDEPTIGLDIVAKNRIREFIVEINRQWNTTIILTTHDMDDIEQICSRLILINDGLIFYDGKLSSFKDEYGDTYKIIIQLGKNEKIEHPLMTVKQIDEYTYDIFCNKKQITLADAVSFLTKFYNVKDIKIQERDIESILRDLYENSEHR
jgi:ABC-2 type transport system ATP-binding protein